jgi:dipeptidyl aminopeptidase/acylaminoacyl peptidase
VALETRRASGDAATTILRAGETDILQGFVWLRDGRILYSLRQPQAGTSAGAPPCSYWQLPIDSAGRASARPSRLAGWLPHCVAAASFSADGRRALYLQWSVEDAIHAGLVDTAAARVTTTGRLTFTEGRNIPSGWTPDDRSIVFVSDSAGRASLYRQAIDGDGAQRLTDEPGVVGAARLTPDATAVLYLSRAGVRDERTLRLMTVPIGGGPSREILRTRFVDGGARCAVAPSTRCVFAERGDGDGEIVFRELTPSGRGRALARRAVRAGGDYRWALSPDGTRIALVNVKEPRAVVVPLDGGTAETIEIAGARTLGYVSWASDGAGLLVPSIDSRGAALLAVDIAGGTRVLWQQPGALDLSAIPSHDGRRMAIWVRTRKSNLWLAESPR